MFGIVFTLAAILCLVTALGVAGDPLDVTNEPTEPWVFDEGNVTTIKSETWTIRYDITVTAGSSLYIVVSDWTFDSADPLNPVKIELIDGYLEFNQTDMSAEEGSPGYYIDARDMMKINGGKITGLASNPSTGAGISIYHTEADISFAEVNGTQGHAIFADDSNLTVYGCTIKDVGGHGIYLDDSYNQYGHNYTCDIFETDIYDISSYAINIRAYDNHGSIYLNTLYVDIHDASYGINVDIGPRSSYNNGDGNVYLNLNFTKIHQTSSYGMYIYNYYQRTGALVRELLLNLTNSEVSNTGSSYGIYLRNYYCTVNFTLRMENFTLRETGSYGFYIYNYRGSTTGSLYAIDSVFTMARSYNIYCYGYFGGFTDGIDFINCEFSEAGSYGLYLNLPYHNVDHVTFENCSFLNNNYYGMYFYTYRSTLSPVNIWNSTVSGNTQAGLYWYSSSEAKGGGFNFTNTHFEDQPGNAVWMRPYYLDGPFELQMVDCTVNNSGPVLFEVPNGPYYANGRLKVNIFNSTFTNITGTALIVKVNVYRYGLTSSINIENSSLADIGGDGVSLTSGITVYGTTRQVHNVDTRILNTTFINIQGSAINIMSQDPESPGKRAYLVHSVYIKTAQRGVFTIGASGEVWSSDFIDILKEYTLVLTGTCRLVYNDFPSINERKFRAMDGGVIVFVFDLQIIVRWNTGAPAIGANVKIMDNKQKLISVQTVREVDGSLPVLTLEPHVIREIGILSQAPYVINVTFLEISRTLGVRLERNEEVIIVIDDHTDPDIFILYPKAGHIQQTTTLEVRGSAWDTQSGIESVQLSLDGRNWTVAEGSWLRWNATIYVTPEQISEFGGLFNLRAKAVDYALNERVVTVIVRVDPTPPELNVDFPYSGYVTNDPELWVRGVTEVGSSVKINGEPVNVVVSMFNHMVTLYEGTNSISVVSIDPLGNIMIEQMKVRLDTQDPFFILITPEGDEMTNTEELIVEAQLEENLKVTINDQVVVYDSDEYVKGSGILECPVSLTSGQNPLEIIVEDEAGNVIVIDRVVTLDRTPPWINVFSPSDGQSLARPEVTIKGTVEPSARLFVQDEDVTIRNGYFERVILALEGPNNVTLVAFDEAGNQYEEILNIFIDTVDPMMSISEPEADYVTVTETRFVISGMIEKDDEGVLSGTRILINGEDSTIIDDGDGASRVMIEIGADGAFSIPIDLEEGRNEYTIEVMDGVENTVSVTKVIYLDTRAPTLVIYLDPIKVEEDGSFSTSSLILNLTGYTEPSSDLRVLDILLGVDEEGRFSMNIDLVEKDDTKIIVTSTDMAGNIRTLEETITHTTGPGGGDGDEDDGLMFLIIALILFVLIAIIAIFFVRTQREHYIEMEIAQSTPIADLEDLDTDLDIEVDESGGEEGAEIGEEAEASSPPRPRPHPRRAAAPRPVRAPVPKMEDKELSDQGAEADIVADETEQEGD
jgi:hypothetical protein